MESNAADISPAVTQPGGNERSTIEFPYSDIDNAVEIVRGVRDVGGTACTYEQVAAHLQAEPKGGSFRMRVNGAKVYGFIDYERGGNIRITDLGFRVLEPTEERAAKAESFLGVPLFAKVYEAFKGRQLPQQAGLERTIIGFGVGSKVADRARQVMLRSAKQAGYMDLQPDRLVQPVIKGGARQSEATTDEPKANKGGGGGNGGGHDHPLIAGLMQTLPQPNSPWSSQERFNWLTMANSIFKIIYQTEDQGDVSVVQVKPPKGDASDLV